MTFEYEVKEIDLYSDDDDDDGQIIGMNSLNILGRQGWEVIQMAPNPDFDSVYTALLKRVI